MKKQIKNILTSAGYTMMDGIALVSPCRRRRFWFDDGALCFCLLSESMAIFDQATIGLSLPEKTIIGVLATLMEEI